MRDDSVLKYRSADDCPDRSERHTKSPAGYIAWHSWAARMNKTHQQQRCPTCGYWSVWVQVRGFVSPAGVTNEGNGS